MDDKPMTFEQQQQTFLSTYTHDIEAELKKAELQTIAEIRAYVAAKKEQKPVKKERIVEDSDEDEVVAVSKPVARYANLKKSKKHMEEDSYSESEEEVATEEQKKQLIRKQEE
jgi:hypothetical protein